MRRGLVDIECTRRGPAAAVSMPKILIAEEKGHKKSILMNLDENAHVSFIFGFSVMKKFSVKKTIWYVFLVMIG
jgi:hypothetical protein